MNFITLTILLNVLYLSFSECFKIEGKVTVPDKASLSDIRILVDDGVYRAFLRRDGSFTVHNVPSGSYVVDVVSSSFAFQPVRVDVSTKGNCRARELNMLKPSSVTLKNYPLVFSPYGMVKYFQTREQFSVIDMLKSPMVLLTVLPMLILLVLPKMMNTNDPELKKEMEESMKMFSPNQSQLPDMSEMMSNFFGGNSPQQPKKLTSSKSGTGRQGKTSKRRNKIE